MLLIILTILINDDPGYKTLRRHDFLNQACAGPARAWFFKIAFVRNVSMCACMRVRMCVCVHLQGYKLHSHDIEPVQPAEHVYCI